MKYLKLFEEAKIRWYDKGKFIEENLPDIDESGIIFSKSFTEFLKDNNAYDKFIYNMRKQHNTSDVDRINKYINSGIETYEYKISQLLNYILCWHDTNEGVDFWSNLHYLWSSMNED